MEIIACLSPFTEAQVRQLTGGASVEVRLVPDPPAPEAVRTAVRDADIVIGDVRQKHQLDRPTLALMRRCRLIQQPTVGFDAVDHQAAAELRIPLANAPGHNADAVADWTLMAILNLVRHGARLDRELRARGWRVDGLLGRDLGALTVGIVGMGKIGHAVAVRLAAFGPAIVYHDVVARDVPGCRRVTFGELLACSDVVTIHVPLDATSKALIGAAELSRMRPGAILCNASRGSIVEESALIAALRSGHLGGAALDVYAAEPLAVDSPLRQFNQVFLTPHIAGISREAQTQMFEMTGANIRRVMAGDLPVNLVDGQRRA